MLTVNAISKDFFFCFEFQSPLCPSDAAATFEDKWTEQTEQWICNFCLLPYVARALFWEADFAGPSLSTHIWEEWWCKKISMRSPNTAIVQSDHFLPALHYYFFRSLFLQLLDFQKWNSCRNIEHIGKTMYVFLLPVCILHWMPLLLVWLVQIRVPE